MCCGVLGPRDVTKDGGHLGLHLGFYPKLEATEKEENEFFILNK